MNNHILGENLKGMEKIALSRKSDMRKDRLSSKC